MSPCAAPPQPHIRASSTHDTARTRTHVQPVCILCHMLPRHRRYGTVVGPGRALSPSPGIATARVCVPVPLRTVRKPDEQRAVSQRATQPRIGAVPRRPRRPRRWAGDRRGAGGGAGRETVSACLLLACMPACGAGAGVGARPSLCVPCASLCVRAAACSVQRRIGITRARAGHACMLAMRDASRVRGCVGACVRRSERREGRSAAPAGPLAAGPLAWPGKLLSGLDMEDMDMERRLCGSSARSALGRALCAVR